MILQCDCGKKWGLKDELAKPGRKVTCRACGSPIPVPDSESEAQKRIQELEAANASLRGELSRAVEERIEEVRHLKKGAASKPSEPLVDAHFLRDLNAFLSSWSASIQHLQEQIQTSFDPEALDEEVLIEEGDSPPPGGDLEETVSDPPGRKETSRSRKTRKN